jgi:hypothetical protein
MSSLSTAQIAALTALTLPHGKRFDRTGPGPQIDKIGETLANAAAGILALDAALTGVSAGQSFKAPVQYVATLNTGRTGNGVPGGGNTQAIAAGKRVLCAGETSSVNNGIWVSAAGAWTRATDFDAATEVVAGDCVPVDVTDSTQPDSVWILTSAAGSVVGTDALTFNRISFLGFGTSPSTQAAGDAAVAGTSNKAAREDHKHAMPRKAQTIVALADSNATLTASQLVDSQLFTIAPTADRTLTTDTAVAILALIPGATVGSTVDFAVTYSPTGAFRAILAGGVGVTIVGSANMGSAGTTITSATKWRIRMDSSTTVSIIRVAG